MKIAILTSGILPVPAVQGGAVENLIDFYLEYNEKHRLHDITVYSVAHESTCGNSALHSTVNHYIYFYVNSLSAKIIKKAKHLATGQGYYHDTILYYLDQSVRDMRKKEFDLIVVENRPGYIPRLRREFPSQNIVLHLHNDLLNADVPLSNEIYNATDGVITISDYIASRVGTIRGSVDKCTTVYNGIDIDRFSPKAEKRNRKNYGISDDDFLLIFSGRIIHEKGISYIIDALHLLANHPQIKLLVLGSSFYDNGSNSSDFINMLKEKSKGLDQRIVFTGYISYDQMPSMLSMADAAVLPSVWEEPLGMTCIEAMAMGLPLITTARGGIPEIVTPDCATILTVDNDLPSSIAKSIVDLYDNPDKRKMMGERGIAAAKTLSKERYAAHFFQAVEQRNNNRP